MVWRQGRALTGTLACLFPWFTQSFWIQRRVAQKWLSDTFAEDADVISSLELAGLLEKRSIEDRHRLVLLLVQEPHVWAARALLGGFYGASLVQWKEGGRELEFSSSDAADLQSWLKGPLECAGNVHLDGLMSLWSWFAQDLAKAAAAPAYCHVAICRVEDLGTYTHGICRAAMRWLWALAALCYAAAKEAEQPRPLNEPAALLESDVKTATGSQVHGDESQRDAFRFQEKQIKKWEEEKAQIAREVEERIKEHADKKQEEEEESEKAESDATFLIFAVLGLAAVARWLCKGQFQREHSGYIIITDTSPTKKRHTSDPAKAWAQKRTHTYRQAAKFTLEEAADIDAPVAELRGAFGYDGSADWRRWAAVAEKQVMDLLEELCKKYAATRSRFDAEQYFCSHCWCTDSSKCPETFAFDGLWTYSSGSLKLGDGAICWQSGLVTHINATSDIAFDMELDGEIFQGKLEDAGNRLVFSDGDVWTRQLPIHAEKSLEAAPCSGSSPPADLPKDASIVDGDIDIETLEWKLQNEEEMLLSEEKIVTAVAEVLFKAIAQHDTERVREGLKQAALLGEEAVIP
eukprot:g29167.t1